MIDQSLAHPSTRELRGLALFEERGREIRFDVQERVWLVPSQHHATSVYEVTLGVRGEFCECADFEHRGAGCKHVYAATIARSKTRPCSGCGSRFPRRELVEVGEEHLAFGHGVREGEVYCCPCGRRHGVL